jgi:hypothetical protein
MHRTGIRRRYAATLFAVATVAAAACSTSNDATSDSVPARPSEPTTSSASSTSVASSTATTEVTAPPVATSPPTTEPLPLPPPDLSKRPLVWFNPLPPLPPGSDLGFSHGSDDYMELFTPDAPWQQAAERVDVFRIYSSWASLYASDEELVQVYEDLRSRGIALAIEVGALPIPEPGTCSSGEGYGGISEVQLLRHLEFLGIRIDIISFGEPFGFGHQLDSPEACQRPVEQVADELARFAEMVRDVYPDAVFGVTEPMWASPEIGPGDVVEWADAYAAAAGEPLAFFHLDMDWERPDWLENAVAVEAALAGRGIPVGYIYNGGSVDTDAGWVDTAAERMALLTAASAVPPDHEIFMSWNDRPYRVLPETDPASFTALVNRYFSPRPVIEASAGDGTLTGSVIADGRGIEGIEVSATVIPDAGVTVTSSATGVVPDGASSAVWIFRVNGEGATSAADVDVRVDEVSFRQGGDNLVPNASFDGGAGWFGYDAGRATVGGGTIRLEAAADQVLLVDSDAFPVTPGAPFELDVTAAIPRGAANAVVAGVVFLAPTEVDRTWILLDASGLTLDPVRTGPDGRFSFDLAAVPPGGGTVDLRVSDHAYWPAFATVRVP